MSDGASRGSRVEALDRKVVFPLSAGMLRVVAAGALVLVALGVLAVLYLSRPSAPPPPPPKPAEPTLPAKPRLKLSDLGAAVKAPARPTPAAVPQQTTAANPARPPTQEEVALEAHLLKYRSLGGQLGIPWDSIHKTVCESSYYDMCFRTRVVVARAGMADLLDGNVFPEGADARQKDAALIAAEGLFSAVAAKGGAVEDLFALRAPERPAGKRAPAAAAGGAPAAQDLDGDVAFRKLFLAPARALRAEFRKIERATPEALPESLRVGLVEDMYPGALTIVKEVSGGPVERAQAVEQFAEAFTATERARLSSSRDLVAGYEKALREREARMQQATLEHEAELEQRKAQRLVILYAVGFGLAAVLSVGVLLALLAIERHLRVLRTIAVGHLFDATDFAAPAGPRPPIEKSA